MGFMDISGQGNNYPMLPVGLAPGEAFILPAGQGVVGQFGGISTPQIGTNNPLSGQYFLQLGQYSTLQMFDDGLNYWQDVNVSPMALVTVSSDGANFRVVNSTGCPVGALITGAGSGGTNGFYGYSQFGAGQGGAVVIQNGLATAGNAIFTITPSAGGSLWNAIVGGGVNTTISFSGTVFNGNLSSQNPSGVGQSLYAFGQGSAAGGITASGGTNYTRAPLIVFTPPPNQGAQPYILPTAVCTISGGVINAITVTHQGAGLIALPGINVVPAPGDLTGGGAVLGWLFGATGTAGNGAGTGSGTVMAMWPYSYGTVLTAVPTFTYGGTSNPAPTVTAIMNFVVTGFTGGTGGTLYTGGVFNGGIVAGTPANTNPFYDKQLSIPIFPPVAVAAAGTPSLSAGGTQFQGVNIQAVPTFTPIGVGSASASAVTVTVGGANDMCRLQTF
jgi:hypothetical protein